MNSFYDKYFELLPEDATKYKDNYIRNVITNGVIYKFIGFGKNLDFNNTKINFFKDDLIWVSHYKYFEDKSELETLCNIKKISKKTKRSIDNIKFTLDTIREIYDITCFTTETTEFMWENYANSHNGFCICFEMIDTDKLFPVEYVEKSKVDLTNSIVKIFNKSDNGESIMYTRELNESAIFPIVLKDVKYENEKEIRFMHAPFDDENGIFKGHVYPGVKDQFGYKGTSVKYELMDLKAKEIIIGRNCKDDYRNALIEIAEKKNIYV